MTANVSTSIAQRITDALCSPGVHEIDVAQASPGSPHAEEVEAADIASALAKSEAKASLLIFRNARLARMLNLSHLKTSVGISFEDCELAGGFKFTSASAGAVTFTSSQVSSIRLAHTEITSLRIERSEVEFIDAPGLQVKDSITIHESKVRFDPSDSSSIRLQDSTIGGSLAITRTQCAGRIDIAGSRTSFNLDLKGTTARSDDNRAAIDVKRAEIRLDLRASTDFECHGTFDLFGTSVGGQVWLNSASLRKGDGRYALNAPLLTVGGGFYCRGLSAIDGSINLAGATIAATLEFNDSPQSTTSSLIIRADTIHVGSNIFFNGARVSKAHFESSRIERSLDFEGCEFVDQSAVSIARSKIEHFILPPNGRQPETVDLRGAHCVEFSDNPNCPPKTLLLQDFSYNAMQPTAQPKARLAWLRRDTSGLSSSSFETLARNYRASGDERGARKVLLAKQRHLRDIGHWSARPWSYIQDAFVGYGYAPGRAFLLLASIVTALSLFYWKVAPPVPLDAAKAPAFNPIPYAIDVLLPILDLGFEKTYQPEGVGRTVTWVAVVVGWVLATAVITAVGRLFSRDR